MKKRILIPYATYGNGHKAIAEYIKNYFETNGEYECLTIDLISYSLPIVGKMSQKVNEVLTQKFPMLWSILYYTFDNKISSHISSDLSIKMFNNKNLKKTIREYNPDITIATHFWGTDLINKYNKKGITNSKIITIVTDYKSHDFWLKSLQGMDAIVVSSLKEKKHLLRKGFKNKQIYTSGIPICPKIENDNNKDICLKNNLDYTKKTILFFLGGGNGASKNYLYFKELIKQNYDCNIIFIAGKNKNIENKAREYLEKHKRKNVKIFGFVYNVSDYYQISDIVIAKPGGAQITECLYYEKPMILIRSSGGPEIANRKYLVKKGYAKHIISRHRFNKVVKELLYNDKTRNKMIKKIHKIEQNKSMEKLFKIVEKIKIN